MQYKDICVSNIHYSNPMSVIYAILTKLDYNVQNALQITIENIVAALADVDVDGWQLKF